MGFLHKLWDETLAGPTPESGLGKLRKFYSMNGGVSSPTSSSSSFSSNSSVIPDRDQIGVSRSINVLRTNPNLRNLTVNNAAASVPDSPVSSVSTPLSPGTPQGDQIQRLTWKKSSAETVERAEPRTPTVYDWFAPSLSTLPIPQEKIKKPQV